MHKLLKQAFTLIELLVVIAIIGILSGLIIVGMSGMTQKATIAKAQVFSNSLRNSLMMNIMGEWKFDGATSERPAVNADVVDSWGGVNNGTIPASPSIPTIKTASNCVSGSCLSFDGVDDYVNCGNGANLSPTDGVTMAAWVKLNVLPSANFTIIVNKGGGGAAGYRMRMYTSGAFYAEIGGFSYSYDDGTTKLKPNIWYYIVSTYNNTTGSLTIYFDTISKSASSPYAGYLAITADPFCIGGNGASGMNGSIDDVRIYNAAIPTSQVKEQYYAGLNKLLANGEITKEDYQNRMGELAMGL